MVARAAQFRFVRGDVADLHGSARSDLPFPGLEAAGPVASGERAGPVAASRTS